MGRTWIRLMLDIGGQELDVQPPPTIGRQLHCVFRRIVITDSTASRSHNRLRDHDDAVQVDNGTTGERVNFTEYLAERKQAERSS